MCGSRYLGECKIRKPHGLANSIIGLPALCLQTIKVKQLNFEDKRMFIKLHRYVRNKRIKFKAMINSNMIPGPIFNHFIFNTYLSWHIIAFLLERVFHSRGPAAMQNYCNKRQCLHNYSHRFGCYGRRFIVLDQQYAYPSHVKTLYKSL